MTLERRTNTCNRRISGGTILGGSRHGPGAVLHPQRMTTAEATHGADEVGGATRGVA
jgi:hypothetical protein